MTDREATRPLTDAALDRELQAALAEEPSPELLLRVRQRIASESEPMRWQIRWNVALMGVSLAVLMAVGAAVWRAQTEPVPAVVSTPSGAPSGRTASTGPLRTAPVAVPTTPAPAAAQPVLSPVAPAETVAGARPPTDGAQGAPAVPEVLVAGRELAGLEAFLTGIRTGRLDASVLAEARSSPITIAPLADLEVAPIVIAPLARLDVLEGDRP